MATNIVRLKEEHIPEAARLVADHCRRLRSQIPLLPHRYEDPAVISDLLGELTLDACSAAAIRDGRLVGFMAGYDLLDYMGKHAFYSPEWANGAEMSHSRMIYEEMYTFVSPEWILSGCRLHVVSLMVGDPAVLEGWHWLGFGMAAVDALRGLAPLENGNATVFIREAVNGDEAALESLLSGLRAHLAGPPSYLLHEMDPAEAMLSDPRNKFWLALDGELAIGCLGMVRGYEEGCQILQDEQTIQVEPVFVAEGYRGRSVTPALLNHALAWAREQGFRRVSVDFEANNLSARRFWLRHFTSVCYSLVRVVDERVMG